MSDRITIATAYVFWSDEDQCYIAQSTEHRRVSAFGDTEAKALAELNIALSAVAEVLAEKGENA